jgi:hypothetical protein
VEVRKLAFNGATDRDICEVLRLSENALRVRFGSVLVEARAGRRVSIRSKQTEVAVKDGNPAILSLLGKDELGQSRTSATGKPRKPEPELEPKVG